MSIPSITSSTSSSLEFLASDEGVWRFGVTIASGQGNIIKGRVLGKITASGKYGPYDNAAVDGRETAVCIAAEGVDATSGDQLCQVVFSGAVYENKLTGIDAPGKTDLANHFLFL